MEFRTGQPRWADLVSRDTDRAVDFYTGLFGWQATAAPSEFGGYITFSRDGHNVGGLMENGPDPGVDDIWTVYLEVDDARETAEAAQTEGAEVLELEDLADLGTWLVITDPTGARVGGWQNIAHTGFETTRGAGAPVWAEEHTRDYRAAVAFYETVFGWETEVLSDTDDYRFTTLGRGADAVAGIQDDSATLAEIEPSYWELYFGVANANETAVRITELGGALLERVADTEYGRMGHAVDPTGARFAILQVA
ncbi:putative enzyme related to lactoylglutathione lyase [Conyzicola lurida]|uniref:Putative enzyme related to lactoylglutathione lyase n=1 Tax=Conyzicola lurida TaxID=1172621 RepID=A0A841AQ42_9MICO|nr:VOC family protein [Conyzicola lurida]MBB5843685.1 putative enzyme related to lactoylglutathione lyase [Conyzicola lurida]